LETINTNTEVNKQKARAPVSFKGPYTIIPCQDHIIPCQDRRHNGIFLCERVKVLFPRKQFGLENAARGLIIVRLYNTYIFTTFMIRPEHQFYIRPDLRKAESTTAESAIRPKQLVRGKVHTILGGSYLLCKC
jgi:hypothetical protein